MTATLTQIRAGIKTRLDTIAGLEVHASVPGTLNVPAAVITPAPGPFATYDTTLGGTTDYSFVVTLLVQRGDEGTGQDALDAYIAPTGAFSVSAAVETDPTLAGLVEDCDVVDARQYGVTDFGGIAYFGCEFTVSVLAGP